MSVELCGFKSWFSNHPDAPGFRTYQSNNIREYIDLPSDGHEATVLFVCYDGKMTRQLHSGSNFMFFYDSPDGVIVDGDPGPREDTETRYPGATIIRGRSITLAVMREIELEMMEAKAGDCGCKNS